MWKLTKRVVIEIAHFLPEHPGLCRNLHGHSIEIFFTLYSPELNENGMVADFGDIKAIANKYDHQCLNDFPEFCTIPPTSENLARLLTEDCLRRFRNVEKAIVSVKETEGSEAEYYLSRE
jgi:6-pyruvoyltetrahydropterin/6-carboxytetrahydropterin synthase